MGTVKIDWTNAFTSGIATDSFEQRLNEMSGRMGEEVEAGKLPFISLPFMSELLGELDELKPFFKRFKHMLVLGIGGSALGARALQKAFFPEQDRPGHLGPNLWILDNVDADTISAMFNKLPARETVVVVISKSGGTIETASQYFLAMEWMQNGLGDNWKDNFFFITDAKTGSLRAQAQELNIPTLPVPDNLGGRYSVLSAVGLVPALFMGLDYHSLVQGARDVASPLAKPGIIPGDLAEHPSWELALWSRACMDMAYDELIFFVYLPLWATFGQWFAQLWAESLGKEGKGSQPIPSVGVTDQHSVNQMFLDGPRNKACLFLTGSELDLGPQFPENIVPDNFDYLRGKRFGELLAAEALGTRMALNQNGVPLVEMNMGKGGLYEAGKMIMLLELTTLLTGWLLDINPLDQPAVELGKRLANARLGAQGLEKEKADLAAFLGGERIIKEL